MKTLIIIPSRMSATRLPGKPLLKINGLSIISHVSKKAEEANIGDVIVATEDQEIIDDVKRNGFNAILTSNKHKTGTDRIHEAYKKIKKEVDCDYIINLQGDEPFINPKDIKKLNDNIIKKRSKIGTIATTLTKNQFLDESVVKVITENNITKNKVSKAKEFLRNYKISKRKKNVYSHVGVYQYKVSILKKFVKLKQTKKELINRLEQLRAIENGIDIDVVYSNNKSSGIDTVEDYVEIKKIMEYKIKKI